MTDNNTIKVSTSIGEFTLAKPKAGVRNRAMVEAESNMGVIKETKLIFLLLPKCVQSRPENVDDTVPIDQLLDDLSTEDYDALATGLGKLMAPPEKEEAEKKTT